MTCSNWAWSRVKTNPAAFGAGARAGGGQRGGGARLALDGGVRAAERGRRGQVGEGDAVVRAAKDGIGAEVVGVLLVRQRLDAEVRDRVRGEDLRGRRRRAGGRGGGERQRRNERRHRGAGPVSTHPSLLPCDSP